MIDTILEIITHILFAFGLVAAFDLLPYAEHILFGMFGIR